MTLFHTLDYADHNQVKKNGGPRAYFQETAVYTYPPFTQLMKLIRNITVEFLQFFMEKWLKKH